MAEIKWVPPEARTYNLACGHTRETFQSRANGQPLYCTECGKEVKVVL